MSLASLVVLLLFTHCIDEPDTSDTSTTSNTAQALVQGAPVIISTSINAPFSAGRYQLIAGKTYTATVVLDSGTITYLTRVEPNVLPPFSTISPSLRDGTVVAYNGSYLYTFDFSTSTNGNSAVAFQIRDRGTNTVYNVGASALVAVSAAATAPRISSTTINAPVWAGRYQLTVGVPYTVTVRVAMSNVTHNARVEGNGVTSSLNMSPLFSNFTNMPQFGTDRSFTFAISPSTTGNYQISYKFKDGVTGAFFSADGGVAVTVNGNGVRRVSEVKVFDWRTGAQITPDPSTGEHKLQIGRRYDISVTTAPASPGNQRPYGIEWNDQIAPAPPSGANLRNPLITPYYEQNLHQYHTHYFTLTPTDNGSYQIGFMIRDCDSGSHPNVPSCTGGAYSRHPGIRIVAGSPDGAPGPLWGYVRDKQTNAVIVKAKVVLDGAQSSAVETNSDGRYHFVSVAGGMHTLTVTAPPPVGSSAGYSTSFVTHLMVPQPSIQVDVELEEFFTSLNSSGITYARYTDYFRGRTVFHVVALPKASTRVELGTSSDSPPPVQNPPVGVYRTAVEQANVKGPKVLINAGYFDGGLYNCDAPPYPLKSFVPLGYRWPRTGYAPNIAAPCPIALSSTDDVMHPVLGITGASTNQTFQITNRYGRFNTSHWQPGPSGWPIWDVFPLLPSPAGDGISDVNFAVQAFPRLITNYSVDTIGAPDEGNASKTHSAAFWPRTAVGILGNGNLVMVVADGEGTGTSPAGIGNSQGANFFSFATFFRDALGVKDAMAFDGGGSASLVIKRNSGAYAFINTPRTLIRSSVQVVMDYWTS
jgi:hypothetical protein